MPRKKKTSPGPSVEPRTAPTGEPYTSPTYEDDPPETPPRRVRDRMFLYSKSRPQGKLFEGEDNVRKALDEGWVDHPKKAR